MITKMIHFFPSGEITHLGEGHIEFTTNDFTHPVDRYVDPVTEYWDFTSVQPRPTNNVLIDKTTCLADGVDVVTLTNCVGKLFLNGMEYPLIDPTILLTFTDAGSHFIRIRNFPTQDFVAVIYAN